MQANMELAAAKKAARQEGISPVYYFFRDLLEVGEDGGRTAGRKIGVVQEIVCRKLLQQSKAIDERMLFERMLPGFSGASHKVEFIVYGLKTRLKLNDKFDDANLTLTVERFERNVVRLKCEDRETGLTLRAPLKSHPRTFASGLLRAPQQQTLDADDLDPKAAKTKRDTIEDLLVKRNLALSYRAGADYVSVLNLTDVLASIESKRVGAQIFKGSDKLGPGIQTIEKAKQTSLVAIDADLGFNRVIRPILRRDGVDPGVRRYISIVTLGNHVHWNANDHNILNTYVDFTYSVGDEVMMRYGTFVEKLARTAALPVPKFFMTYFNGMTKASPDAFAVMDRDLSIIEPQNDARSICAVLEQHIEQHNPVH